MARSFSMDGSYLVAGQVAVNGKPAVVHVVLPLSGGFLSIHVMNWWFWPYKPSWLQGMQSWTSWQCGHLVTCCGLHQVTEAGCSRDQTRGSKPVITPYMAIAERNGGVACMCASHSGVFSSYGAFRQEGIGQWLMCFSRIRMVTLAMWRTPCR